MVVGAAVDVSVEETPEPDEAVFREADGFVEGLVKPFEVSCVVLEDGGVSSLLVFVSDTLVTLVTTVPIVNKGSVALQQAWLLSLSQQYNADPFAACWHIDNQGLA